MIIIVYYVVVNSYYSCELCHFIITINDARLSSDGPFSLKPQLKGRVANQLTLFLNKTSSAKGL